MKTILIRFDIEAERNAALAEMPAHPASTAIAVTAYEQVAVFGETGEVLTPAIETEGYWLLKADEAGTDPLNLPEGVVAISPVFMGMA